MPADDDRPAYERGTGFLLARLGSLAARSWSAFLAGHGLTQSQYTVLTVLAERDALGQRRLAELVAVDARNLVPVLDALAARGLVARRPDPSDGRRRLVALTYQGTALVAALTADAAAGQDDFLSALAPEERRRLNDLLRRLYASHVSG